MVVNIIVLLKLYYTNKESGQYVRALEKYTTVKHV